MNWLQLIFHIISDVKVFLVAIGFLLLVCATLREINIKGNILALERYQRIVFVALGLSALTFAVLAYIQPPPPIPALPKGSIIMWWGAKETWPKNFELCDGHFSKQLGFDKPDLQGRFVRGAKPEADRISQFERAGADKVSLPAHEHILPELVAGWGPRIAPQDTTVFQEIPGSEHIHGGIGRGIPSKYFKDDLPEGNNLLAEFRGTAVFAIGAGTSRQIKTISTSQATIATIPNFQEMFYIIKTQE